MHRSAVALLLVAPVLVVTSPRHTSSQTVGSLPLNPAVQALVDSVSVERLTESVLTLADFTTRNTDSDTTSSTTGVGAARRWVRDQFEALAMSSGGSLAAGYFDWDGAACGTPSAYRNVIATQPGLAYPDRYLLMGAHLDSRTIDVCNATSLAPGANDDGSGCAAALEVSYLLGKLDLDSSVQYHCFTGEEQGLLGSTAFADEALANGSNIAAMFNNDTIGNITSTTGVQDSTSCRSFSGGPATSTSRQLARYIKLKAEAYQPGFTVHLQPLLDRPGRGGDHIPFYDNGFAAARLIETLENGDGSGQNGHQHNGTDLPQYMNFEYLVRNVRVNVAAFASLALAPLSPVGAGAVDTGSGSEVEVTWAANSEPDLAGYRVAYRYETGDSLFYQAVVDAGLTTTFTLSGLAESVPILVSVSAYDTEFNESVFGDESRVVPQSQPSVPLHFRATSGAQSVTLRWDASPELDIQSYRIYRALDAGGPYTLLATVPHPQTSYVDATPAAGVLYHYELRGVDTSAQEGGPAGPQKGRLVDHAAGILIVDATPDGTGGINPTDLAVDLFYDGVLAGQPVAGHWDRATEQAAQNPLSDADMGGYTTVVYHVDAFTTGMTTAADTTELREYAQHGGRLLVSATRASYVLGGAVEPTTVFGPGEFMHDVFQYNEAHQSEEFDMAGAFGQLPGYPDLDVDESKYFLNRLPAQDAYIGPVAGLPTTEVIYRYQSFSGAGANHDLPNAVRFLSPELRIVAFSLPLYFMDSLSARTAILTALSDLAMPTTAADAAAAPALAVAIRGVAPNPFNPATQIEFEVNRRAKVQLQIFDVHGRLVRTLVDGRVDPGRHHVDWHGQAQSGRGVRSGVYFLELRAGDQRHRQKIVLVR